MSTHNICFHGEIIREIFTWYPLLSGAMTFTQSDQGLLKVSIQSTLAIDSVSEPQRCGWIC